jgi:pimeloyl-ACP methyl ester carboxylesterase
MAASQSVKVHQRQIWLKKSDPEIRIHYMESLPKDKKKGTILLVHGFPQTAYQFRLVMVPLAEAGYHVIAPDCRGHGFSSKPLGDTGYTKKELSNDFHQMLTEHLGITEKVHIVGHDIGGMVTHAYVAQFPDHVASVTWGEVPLPGSTIYDKTKHTRELWHFDFQSHNPELSATLVTGKERIYLKSFYDRFTQNQAVFTPEVVDFYTMQFQMPDALRCAFLTYRQFEIDAEHNRQWREKNGKVTVRTMVLSGDRSFIVNEAEAMANEFYANVTNGVVADCGHYLAEENPEDFVSKLVKFIESA